MSVAVAGFVVGPWVRAQASKIRREGLRILRQFLAAFAKAKGSSGSEHVKTKEM